MNSRSQSTFPLIPVCFQVQRKNTRHAAGSNANPFPPYHKSEKKGLSLALEREMRNGTIFQFRPCKSSTQNNPALDIACMTNRAGRFECDDPQSNAYRDK